MGNIYAAQKKYPQAIKMYRMALDQIGETHKSVRCVGMCGPACVYVHEKSLIYRIALIFRGSKISRIAVFDPGF